MPPPERLAGVVGKTNVGKSTFFAAATLAPVEIGNRPFVTLKPNVGVAYVRVRCAHTTLHLPACNPSKGFCRRGYRFIPVKLIDVPGLIPGAHRGRGLGNQFLDQIRQADAIILVVDAAGATDPEGNPAKPGTYDPIEEVRFIEEELDEWIYSIIRKDWERFARRVDTAAGSPVDALAQRLSGLSIDRGHVERALEAAGLAGRKLTTWTSQDLRRFATELRKAKPMVIAANKADIPEAEDNIKRMQRELKGYWVIPVSALAEYILRRAARAGLIDYLPGDSDFRVVDEERLTPKQERVLEMIRERVLRKWGSTGVQETINTTFLKALDMIVVYPVEDQTHYTDKKGRVLPDAYLVPRGTTARQLAYMIHTDLGKTFLYAIDARTKMRIGEEHQLKDGDVVKIVAAAARHG